MNKLYYKEILGVKNGRVSWIKSIGKEIPFVYNDKNGVFKILDYNVETRKIKFEYDNQEFEQNVDTFKDAKFKYIFSKIFKYKVGEIISDEKYQSKIIEQKFVEVKNGNNTQIRKKYKYECLKCGYIGIRNESDIGKKWCPCCAGKKVVQGINDIPTITPWLIPYFQGGEEEARQYTTKSNKKIYPRCPDCGRVRNKLIPVRTIWQWKSIGCECSNSKSYPNKFIIALLRQLKVDFNYEIIFSWAKNYRYDAVIYLNKDKERGNIIIEMDGFGHGNKIVKNPTEDQILKQRNEILYDMEKEITALRNYNYLIRIDCEKSDMEYIRDNILNSKLSELFDLSNIDWDECDMDACSNITKQMAEYILLNNDATYTDLKEKFCYRDRGAINRHLKKMIKLNMIDEQLVTKIRNNGLTKRPIYIYDKELCLIKSYSSIDEAKSNVKNDIEKNIGVHYMISNNFINKNTLYKGKYYVTDHKLIKNN